MSLIRSEFERQLGVNGATFDIQKVQSFAALVMSYDELKGIISRTKNLGCLEKYNMNRALDEMVERSLKGLG